jgi:predicted RNA binding protein YcfA (HicA-like mRNA interferase family)
MPMSGKEMLWLFEKNGWRKIRQKGSHVVVHKEGEMPETIPMHKELKTGLEKKLLKRLEFKK